MQRVTRSQAAGRTACSTCHLRKVRCDAQEVGFPCSNCRSASRDDCHRHVKRKRRSARLPERSPLPPSSMSSYPSVPGASPVLRSELSSAAGFDISSEREHVYKKHLVEFIHQPELTIRPIDKDARLTYVGTDVSNINFLVQQQFGSGTANVCHFPTNRIARQHTCHEPNSLPAEAFQLPAKDIVDRLLDGYFTQINPGFPVVDEAIFLDQYRARDPLNPPSLLLLHAILLVGAHVCLSLPDREVLKTMFFRRAKSLFDSRFERNRDTVVQAALLLTWHNEGPEDVSANAWFWLGIAATTAKGMGMHRDAENSTLVAHNKRMWRRVWWLLVQCDVLVSIQYGRPQFIRLDESDVQPLKPSDFQDCGRDCRVEYVMQMSELCRFISDALRERFRIAATPQSRQTVLRTTDDALASWSLRLPPGLQVHNKPTLDVWTANLQLVYNTVLILIHRVQLDHGQPMAASHESREDSDICITAAGAIESLFRDLCERGETRYLWSSSINYLFTALIQLSIEVQFSNPVLAISALRRYESALMSLRDVARYWPNAQSVLSFFEASSRLQHPQSHRQEESVEHEQASSAWNVADAPFSDSAEAGQALAFLTGEGKDASRNVPRPRERPSEQSQDTIHESSTTNPVTPQPQDSQEDGNAARQEPTRAPNDEINDMFGDIRESWQEWRESYWQQPEFADEFLFTF